MSNHGLEPGERLADLLVRENAALRSLDFQSAVALVPAKEEALAELANPKGVAISGTELAKRLRGLAAENQMLLERAISVQTRIVRIIARACAPPPAASGYQSRRGRQPPRQSVALALSTHA